MVTHHLKVYHHAAWWYSLRVPTARRRYQVTETDDVARALDEAAKRWPGEPRSRLIVRAIVVGGNALTDAADHQNQLAAIRRVQGTYAEAYGQDYLRELRSDWSA